MPELSEWMEGPELYANNGNKVSRTVHHQIGILCVRTTSLKPEASREYPIRRHDRRIRTRQDDIGVVEVIDRKTVEYGLTSTDKT